MKTTTCDMAGLYIPIRSATTPTQFGTKALASGLGKFTVLMTQIRQISPNVNKIERTMPHALTKV